MKKIIFIKDSGSFSEDERFVALEAQCFEAISFISDEPIRFDLKEKSNDIAELLMNQIMCSAVKNVAVKSIFILKSNNFSVTGRNVSLRTIRYFIEKRKQVGDVFFFVGKGRRANLIAKFLGFSKVKLKNSRYYQNQGR